ncbi:MAG TPA: allophanate hydrolase subunit 1 [Streptosporangiaceae bacterium]
MRFRPAGPSALLVEVDSLSQARALHAEIGRRRAAGWAPSLLDVVPGARTVLLDGIADHRRAAADIRSWTVPPVPPGAGPVTEIHCRYDGPDLPAVAAQWRVSVAQAVRIHTSIEHEVAFCGFAPGFPYIAGLGPGREVARRDSPRAAIPAGSVALGGEYTGVYPRASPGGWQVIGQTDAVMWDSGRDPAALLTAGDRVRFIDVTS